MSMSKERLAAAEDASTLEKAEPLSAVGTKADSRDDPGGGQQNFQVRRPDTLLFATIEGLQKQSGVSRKKKGRTFSKSPLTQNFFIQGGSAAGRWRT